MIVVVEGIPGSGKTTTLKKLSERLDKKGIRSFHYFEYSENNPVGYKWSFENAEKSVRETTLELYPFHLWKKLPKKDLILLESRFLQNTCLFSLMNSSNADELITFPRRIIKEVANNRIKLILLHQNSLKNHLEKIIKERKVIAPTWYPFVTEFFRNSNWCKLKKFQDQPFEQAMIEWSGIQLNIFNDLQIDKLKIEDPYRDWALTIQKALDFIL